MSDAFNLHRFIVAQESVYASVVEELRNGSKIGHWMWFIFPQVRGLGASAMSRMYAIGSRDEARAFNDHPLLGARLRECTRLVTGVEGRTAMEVFGSPDHLKFRSCMTLFRLVVPQQDVYDLALRKYFGGVLDRRTLTILGEAGS